MGILRGMQFLFCALAMLLFQPLASSPMMQIDHSYVQTNDVRLEEVDPDKVLIDMVVKENPHLSKQEVDVSTELEQQDEHSVNSSGDAHENVIPTDIFYQNYYLQDFGLTRRNIYGDGNCLFRALSVGLFGTETRHGELRQLAIDNIRNNRELFADYFLPQDASANRQEHMDGELNRLIQTGVYAGFECIVSLSMVFGRNIYITQGGSAGSRVSTITVTIDESSGYDSSNNIHLIYSTSIGGGHYDLAVEDTTGSHFPNDNVNVDKSETDTVKSETNTVQTQTGIVKPETNTVQTQTGTVKSGTGNVKSRTGTIQAGTGTDQSRTSTVQSGTSTVKSGTGTVQSRTSTVQSGTGTVQSGTGTLKSGTGTVQSRTSTVQSGTGTVQSGSGTVMSGTGTVQSGTSTVKSGTGTVQSGTSTVKYGTGTVQSRTSTVLSGTGVVQSRTGIVKSGTDTIRSGTGTVQPGTGTVQIGTNTVQSGTDTVKSGTGTVQPGTGTVQTGTDTVQSGTDTVKSGTGTVQSRTSTVQPGTGAVQSGTDTVQSGTSTVQSGTDTVQSGKGTGTVQSRTSTIQSDTGTVQSGTDTVQSGTSTAQSGTGTVQPGTDNVQSGTDTVISGTDTVQSKNDTVLSVIGSVLSRNGTALSVIGTVQSKTGTVVSVIGALQPETGTLKSGTDNVISTTGNVQVGTDTVQSGTSTVQSRIVNVLSGTCTVQCKTDTVLSGTGNVLSGTDNVLSGTDTVLSGTDTVLSGTDNVLSGTDTVLSGTDTVLSLDSNHEPVGEAKPLSVSKSTSTISPLRCSTCNMKFSCKKSLTRHTKNQHVHKSTRQTAHITCIEPSCTETFSKMETYYDHLYLKHIIEIENKTVTFESNEEFLIWKGKEESNNNVFFFCKDTKQKADGIYKFYNCNRSGNCKRNKLKLKRSKNKKGSCKLGHVCPARMIASIKSNLVTVRYTNVHFHSTGFDQTKYLRIPEPVKKEIGIKLNIGVPMKHILSSLQSPHSVSRKDINNIKMRQIKVLTECDKDDANSVNLKVLGLQKSLSNPVLLFKQQQVVDDNIDLNQEDFMLVLMTNEQAKAFEKYAPYVLCIDSTHGTNQYQFYLITMLVINDEKKDIPVAFCVSNREDGDTLHIFFECVKKRCPGTEIDSVMCPDAQASVARAVFGQHVNHYLCLHNLRSSWNTALQPYGNPAQLAEFQDALTELVHSNTKQQFVQRLNQLRNTYRESHAAFFNYFDQYYIYRPETWALYAMKEGLLNRIDTNNYLEDFHRTLKYSYFDREFNHIIHRLVDVLLDFELIRECYIDMIKSALSENSKTNFDKSGRHRISCEIPDNYVQMIDENTYSVISSDGSKVCHVQTLKSECDIVPCFVTCCIDPCVKLCIHLYKCSCLDMATCCKHIHKVHSMKAMIHEQSEESYEPAIVSYSEDEMDTNQENDDRNVRLFHQNLQKLESNVNSGMSTERLIEVNEALESIIADNNAYQRNKRKKVHASPIKENYQQVKRLSFDLNTVNVTEIVVYEDMQY